MAKYNQGIDGHVMGKVGQHIWSKWKSIYYMRVVAAAVRNPRTTAQLKVRARFSRLMELAASYRQAFNKGFLKNSLMPRMTQSNIFITKNWAQVTATSPDDVTVNYSKLAIAEGNLAGISIGTVDYGEDQHLTISVPITGSTGGSDADADDNIYLFAYCPDMNMGMLGTPVKRSAAAATLTLPGNWDGQTIHLYAFAEASEDNPNLPFHTCSNSLYCGTGEVQ